MYSDGHEPGNLISTDAKRRCRGFRSERFVKPPVQVALTSRNPLCVQSVLVSPAAQRCAVELWVCRKESRCSGDRVENSVRPSSVRVERDGRWCCSVRCDCVPGIVTRFQNARYRDDLSPVYGSFLSSGASSDLVCETVDLRSSYLWLSTCGVAVRIIHVEGTAIPALQTVEIWGVIASDCCESQRKTLLAVCEGLRRERQSSLKDAPLGSRKRRRENIDAPEKQVSVATQSTSSVTVPDEFLDEITFEVMFQPILLPSGHTVDASTVEKHTKTEAIWGRPASDPFTGLPYSSNNKPIPYAILKARIDQFLNDYGHCVEESVGRRLGTNQKVESDCLETKESVLVTQPGRQHSSSPPKCAGTRDICKSTVELRCSAVKETLSSGVPCSSNHSVRLQLSLDTELRQVLGQSKRGKYL